MRPTDQLGSTGSGGGITGRKTMFPTQLQELVTGRMGVVMCVSPWTGNPLTLLGQLCTETT